MGLDNMYDFVHDINKSITNHQDVMHKSIGKLGRSN